MSEQAIVNQILDWLHLNGAWAIRINSGGKSVENAKGQKHFIRMAPAGTPDIIACWPGGLMMGIECKVPGNEPTDIQAATLQQIRDIGGLAVVAYSSDDVEAALKERMEQCQRK
jgi:Holliday junction resolvase